MFLVLFNKKVKVVKVKRKKKAKKAIKRKITKPKIIKPKVRKSPAKAKRKRPTVKKVKRISKPKEITLQQVGKVTHYFPHVKAGVVLVTDGTLALGDTLQIKGETTDFKQKVTSMQINNVPIDKAKPGQEIGLLVKSRVRHNDVVYKL